MIATNHINSASDELAYSKGYRYDEAAADKVFQFFERCLVHTMGDLAGEPFLLLDWQRHVLGELFGWVHPDTGKRRYTKGDIFVAKKQGKSTLASGIALYFLTTFGRRSQVFGAAFTRDQAGIIYREAAEMARRSPALRGVLKPLDTHKRIVYGEEASFYQALAGEAGAAEGHIASLVIFDEIHVQKNRALYDSLVYATNACPNSMMLSVSTVGVSDQTSIWWEQYQYAKGILAGTIEDYRRFAYVAQADEECINDWERCGDPAEWKKAMPSLNTTVTEETIRQHYTEATNAPAKQNSFKRYLLNIPTAQVEKCVPIEDWRACEGEVPDLTGRVCYGGLDMASSEDLTAFVLYFPGRHIDVTHLGSSSREYESESSYVKAWVWAPEAKIRERERKGQAHYRQWVDDGWLIPTEGERVDHDTIREAIIAAFDRYRLHEVGFDKWNADAVVNPLLADGRLMVQVEQTISGMTAGCTGIIDDMIQRRVRHDGNPVLTWCLGNCAGQNKDDALRFDKSNSADKIDAAVALAIAKGRALANASDSVPMIY